jgi:hypothetical protein
MRCSENVEAAKVAGRRIHDGHNAFLRSHVSAHEQSPAAQFLQFADNLLATDHIDLGDYHGRTFAGKTPRHALANAATSAGNQGNPAFK